jgi:hypothetical protein
MKYEKSYVAGACLLPSYLCGALLLAKASIIVWLIGMAALILLTNMLYQWCVLIPINTKLKQWQRYLLTFFAQLVFWGIGIFTLQLN